MGATFNTGYLENLILYNGSNNIGIGTSADATYKVTLGGSLLGTTANFTGAVTSAGLTVTGTNNDFYVGATFANTINFGYNTNTLLGGWVNYTGYLGGTTQFRDFNIGNGKNGVVAFFQGSTGNVGINTNNPESVASSINLQIDGASHSFVRTGTSTYGGYFSTIPTADVLVISNVRNPVTGTYSNTGKASSSIQLFSASSNGYIVFNTTDTNNSTPTARLTISSTGAATFSANSTTVELNTSTRALKITGKDNYYPLELIGGTTTGQSYGPFIKAGTNSSDQSFVIQNSAANKDYFTVRGDGDVGIGTSNPLGKFHIEGNYVLLNTEGSAQQKILYFRYSNEARIQCDSYFTFYTGGSPTERMRITSGGYLKASNDGSYYGSTALYHELKNNTANGYTVYISNSSSSPASTYIADFFFSASTPNNSSARFWNCDDATAARAYMRSDGGLANYQTYDANLSDIRVKKDITPLESYWNKFKALEIVKFKYKDQTHDDYNIGVIAQQVEEVAPEFVDIDGWDKTPEDGVPLKSIYTADLHHATIKVLQEAMAKIEKLETEIDTLKK